MVEVRPAETPCTGIVNNSLVVGRKTSAPGLCVCDGLTRRASSRGTHNTRLILYKGTRRQQSMRAHQLRLLREQREREAQGRVHAALHAVVGPRA